MKNALITGITGQDGSYLAELLLSKGYEVHGLVRRSSLNNRANIKHIEDQLTLHYGDLSDTASLRRIFDKHCFDEVYNLGAMSHVKISFDMPEYTGNVDGLGVLRLLEIIKADYPSIRFYQASTSELFGKAKQVPQTEETPFHPRSPYGVAKLYAYWAVVNYREAYNLYSCNGILFNHESSRRGDNFVTRKITKAAARIKLGLQKSMVLGNLDAKRDWGFAMDYVEGMWMMLQQDTPEDYILASNRTTTVRAFVEASFKEIGIDIVWQGESVEEQGIHPKTGEVLVNISPEYYRPAEVDILLGDYSKAKRKMGWEPKTSLEELVGQMVQADLEIESQNMVTC